MAGVGGVACSFVKGSAASLRQRVLAWFTPGIDGQSALLLGFNEGEFDFTIVLYDSLSNVLAWKSSIESLQGNIVSIVDDFGTSWGNCLVTRVQVSPRWRSPAQGSGVVGVTTRGEMRVSGLVVA